MNPPALRVNCPACHAHPAHPCRSENGRAAPLHEARELAYSGLAEALAFDRVWRRVDRAMSDRRYDCAGGQGRW